MTLSCPPLRRQNSFVTDLIWYWLMVSDKPPCPQNAPAVVAKHVQVAFLRHRKRAKICTGNRHDLGSGNAKLQPEAARESCGEVFADFTQSQFDWEQETPQTHRWVRGTFSLRGHLPSKLKSRLCPLPAVISFSFLRKHEYTKNSSCKQL